MKIQYWSSQIRTHRRTKLRCRCMSHKITRMHWPSALHHRSPRNRALLPNQDQPETIEDQSKCKSTTYTQMIWERKREPIGCTRRKLRPHHRQQWFNPAEQQLQKCQIEAEIGRGRIKIWGKTHWNLFEWQKRGRATGFEEEEAGFNGAVATNGRARDARAARSSSAAISTIPPPKSPTHERKGNRIPSECFGQLETKSPTLLSSCLPLTGGPYQTLFYSILFFLFSNDKLPKGHFENNRTHLSYHVGWNGYGKSVFFFLKPFAQEYVVPWKYCRT